jgi:pyrrolidone-carboxylate peptidase
LGVDEKSSHIKLESQAYNEAKFRIPDQAGWQPDGIAINRQEHCTFVRKTNLPVKKLAGNLNRKEREKCFLLDINGSLKFSSPPHPTPPKKI